MHEPELLDYYLSQTGEVQRGNYNQSPNQSYALVYPDITCINGGPIVGVNRKQASEWLGGLDQWEEQLHKEVNGPIDYLVSIIEGQVIPAGEGSIALSFQDLNYTTRRNSHSVDVQAKGEMSRWPYKALMGKVQAMWDIGIPVIFTSNLLGSAIFISELHHRASEGYESQTFKRFIKEKWQISETDLKLREQILLYMNIPGIGEDKAIKLADTYNSMVDLINRIDTVRTIPGFGPVIEKRMREFLGVG